VEKIGESSTMNQKASKKTITLYMSDISFLGNSKIEIKNVDQIFIDEVKIQLLINGRWQMINRREVGRFVVDE
jgi:hypothetical protein